MESLWGYLIFSVDNSKPLTLECEATFTLILILGKLYQASKCDIFNTTRSKTRSIVSLHLIVLLKSGWINSSFVCPLLNEIYSIKLNNGGLWTKCRKKYHNPKWIPRFSHNKPKKSENYSRDHHQQEWVWVESYWSYDRCGEWENKAVAGNLRKAQLAKICVSCTTLQFDRKQLKNQKTSTMPTAKNPQVQRSHMSV